MQKTVFKSDSAQRLVTDDESGEETLWIADDLESDKVNLSRAELRAMLPTILEWLGPEPIPIILHCPVCGTQHIDAEEPLEEYQRRVAAQKADPTPEGYLATFARWTNPPHKSHLCHTCGAIWRPADIATTGVEKIQTRGDADTWWPIDCKTCGDTGEVIYESGSPVDIEPTQ